MKTNTTQWSYAPRWLSAVAASCLVLPSFTTPSPTAEDYFEQYAELAVREMNRSGIPASITLAQALVESNCGKSELAYQTNNHFGIKSKRDWDGATFCKNDDERDERGAPKVSCFRKYESVEDSYEDHTLFIMGDDRYEDLFRLAPFDYVGWARGLKAKNYASRENYDEILIKKIEQYGLARYDQMLEIAIAGGETEQPDGSIFHSKNGDAPPPVVIPNGYERGSMRVPIKKEIFIKKGTPQVAISNHKRKKSQ